MLTLANATVGKGLTMGGSPKKCCETCGKPLELLTSKTRCIRPYNHQIEDNYYRWRLIEAYRELGITPRRGLNDLADFIEYVDVTGVFIYECDGVTQVSFRAIDEYFENEELALETSQSDPGGGWFRLFQRRYPKGSVPRLQRRTFERYLLIALRIIVLRPDLAAKYDLFSAANDNTAAY